MSAALTAELIHTLRRKANGDADLIRLVQDALGAGPEHYLAAVSAFLGLPAVSADEMDHLTPRFDLLAFADALEKHCVATEREGMPTLILGDPFSFTLRSWAQQKLGGRYAIAFAHPQSLAAWLGKLEQQHRAMDQLDIRFEGGSEAGNTVISLSSIAQDASPVIKLVNSTLYDALKRRASDIHFESTGTGVHVKYRIDGVLVNVGGASGAGIADQVLSRLKVLAELDIAERRVPQDGRFKARIAGRDVDFRVSVMPSLFGEDAVLRLLDKEARGSAWKTLSLEVLGLDADTVAGIRQLARTPYGLMLVTGPTGSGKSTTLYATLSEINTGDEKIITIEDPVEYQIAGILQIPVNEKKGLSFSRGLRSILRHDPDKILVGEIRDAETAGIAVQAAQTGHLVLASIHANHAFSVIDRFRNMGVEPHAFLDALIGVVAQRLIRMSCPHCLIDDAAPDAASLAASGLSAAEVAGWRFRHGQGCAHCHGTGYSGRRPIAEVLQMTDGLKEALARGTPTHELRALAARNDFVSLRRLALRAVARGETTLQEINRATFVD